jgi:pimeloyl-ACP methyl ester carboxylesterase
MVTHNENHSHLHSVDGLDIETLWINPHLQSSVVVFLHEGLGSVALWRDFPQQLCDAIGMRGLVFSRAGYGQSTPRQPLDHWPADFMHRQAIDFLPTYLASLGIDTTANPPIFFGHSDGASIALIYAATYPAQTRAVIALAPHSYVESVCIEAIQQGRINYETDPSHPKSMRSRLLRYHADVDSAFYGWCDAWLSSEFQSFDIRPLLGQITFPVLAMQGIDDSYGTMAQIEQIQSLVTKASLTPELLKLSRCGHSPHIDQPEQVIATAKAFIMRSCS